MRQGGLIFAADCVRSKKKKTEKKHTGNPTAPKTHHEIHGPATATTSRRCTTKQVPLRRLVRWATGERLTDRLPNLSLITLSPPLNSGILSLRMGPYVPTPRFLYNLWGPKEIDSSGSCHEEIHFSLKSVFMVGREIRTHDQQPMVCRRRHLGRH